MFVEKHDRKQAQDDTIAFRVTWISWTCNVIAVSHLTTYTHKFVPRMCVLTNRTVI